MSRRKQPTGHIAVLLVGPPGSGKSRLATELKPVLEKYGVTIVCSTEQSGAHLLANSQTAVEWGIVRE